ncbi:MAG TPA: hypothetical protein ENK04_09805 [Gammaproteobacteria bacterium]|nr:hypothetical protein [Gammaproteobacteria bacterium]
MQLLVNIAGIGKKIRACTPISFRIVFDAVTTTNYVEHDCRIKLTAKPLLDIDIQVDIPGSVISLAPLPVYEFGNDDKGIYFPNTVEFKGADVTLTKL